LSLLPWHSAAWATAVILIPASRWFEHGLIDSHIVSTIEGFIAHQTTLPLTDQASPRITENLVHPLDQP
jgi:hypothetical protein